MKMKIVVLAKQVPDTRNVGKDAMKEDGTVNREFFLLFLILTI